MDQKTKKLFLIVVLCQACHSLEEFTGRLWESFPPAEALCDLISDDHETGFLIINIGILLFGLAAYLFFLKKNNSLSNFIIWFWVFIGFVNGIGHLVWSILQKEYTPGLATSQAVFLTTILLLIKFRETD
ncbi:MAG: HXXEE domain-containing protein [Saprospiraceae bacterium]|nr:HXXEE domain-containing protein [Bacteroidia bacterium]NNE16595.1 HXXEE domain-containing protein [Saprospiraceae bacterium]